MSQTTTSQEDAAFDLECLRDEWCWQIQHGGTAETVAALGQEIQTAEDRLNALRAAILALALEKGPLTPAGYHYRP